MAIRKNRNGNGWTPERRARQSLRCCEQKPWQHATGPRTKTGKKKSAANALRHGGHSAPMRDLSRALTAHTALTSMLIRKLGDENAQ